jgi:hypothetical protein
MDAGLKQDLIGVQVSDARQYALVHEHGLDHPASGCKMFLKLLPSHGQRVRAQPLLRNERRDLLRDGDPSKESLVIERQLAAICEADQEPDMRRGPRCEE